MNKNEIKVMEIMGLAYMVNTRTEKCVFVTYSGHIDSLEINIRKSKDRYISVIADSELYETSKQKEIRLDEVIAVLKEIINSKNIPYDMMTELERIEYDYKF